MRILIPDHLESRHLERLRELAPDVKLASLHLERRRALWPRIGAAAAKRALPYRAYVALRPTLEKTRLAVSVDGVPLEEPLSGIDVLMATWAFDSGSTRRVTRLLPDLRWVHSTVSGVDHFDLRELAERGIVLTSARSVHSRRIAEYVLAMIYAHAKNLPAHIEATRRKRARFMSSWELAELTTGIIGFGSIGREVARLARANDLRVVAFVRDERRSPSLDGVELTTDMPYVLRSADVLVLALPLTPETKGLIGARELALMKASCMLVNVGRPSTVVESDLVQALGRGRLRGACLDGIDDPVTGRPLGCPPPNHPLYKLGDVILTGYSSSESMHSSDDLTSGFLRNVVRYRQGEPLDGLIDLGGGY